MPRVQRCLNQVEELAIRIQPDLTVHIKSGGMDFHVFGVRCRPACFPSGLILWCGLPHRGRERLRTLFRLLCCGTFD